MQRVLSWGLCLGLLWQANGAQAAIVAKVDPAKKLVLLKLKKSEAKLVPGKKEISFTLENSNVSFKGHVKRLKGASLVMQIKEGSIEVLSKGSKVTLSIKIEDASEAEPDADAEEPPVEGGADAAAADPATGEAGSAEGATTPSAADKKLTKAQLKAAAKAAAAEAKAAKADGKASPFPIVPFASPLFDEAAHAYGTKKLDVDASLGVLTASTADESDIRGLYQDTSGVGIRALGTYHLKGTGIELGSNFQYLSLTIKSSIEQAKDKTTDTAKGSEIDLNFFVLDQVAPGIAPFLELGMSQIKTPDATLAVTPIRLGLSYMTPQMVASFSLRPKASKESETAKYVLPTQISLKLAYQLNPGVQLGAGLDYTMQKEASENDSNSTGFLIGSTLEVASMLRFHGYARYDLPYFTTADVTNLGGFGLSMGAEYLMKQASAGLRIDFHQGTGLGQDEKGKDADLFAQEVSYVFTYSKQM